MKIDLLRRRSEEDLVEHVETNTDSPDQLRAARLKKLINRLISLEDIDAEEVQPIIEALKTENERKITPLFRSLDNLVVLRHQHPDEKEDIDSTMSDTADLILDDVTSIKETEPKSDVGINVVWSAIKAWDEVRDEPTSKLCVAMLDDFPGGGQASLSHAYIHARDTAIRFDIALDHVNAAEILAQKTGLKFREALAQVSNSKDIAA